MIRRPPRSTLFPTRRSSDLRKITLLWRLQTQKLKFLRRQHGEAVDRLNERIIAVYQTGDVTAVELLLRSEEHTSELQSRQYLVCRLLLEKKKKFNQFMHLLT